VRCAGRGALKPAEHNLLYLLLPLLNVLVEIGTLYLQKWLNSSGGLRLTFRGGRQISPHIFPLLSVRVFSFTPVYIFYF
jgi:hypothetical protein